MPVWVDKNEPVTELTRFAGGRAQYATLLQFNMPEPLSKTHRTGCSASLFLLTVVPVSDGPTKRCRKGRFANTGFRHVLFLHRGQHPTLSVELRVEPLWLAAFVPCTRHSVFPSIESATCPALNRSLFEAIR